MHRLLDRLNYIAEEMKDMQHGFADSEEHALDVLRETAQNILKKTYETERRTVSANFEKIGTNAITSILQIFKPDSAITHNFSQMASQDKSRRDSRLKSIDLAYHSTLKKINQMSVREVFEFLDIFSKKNLQGTVVSSVIVVKPISKRIEIKLVPVKN